MTSSTEPRQLTEDEAWLEVVAGRPVSTMDDMSRQEAEGVRAALLRRRKRLTHNTPQLDDAAFERLLFRMKKEGVDSGRSKAFASRPSFIWGIAASLATVSVISFQLLSMKEDDEFHVLRGPHATVIIDSNPSARLDNFRATFTAVGLNPEVKMGNNGTVVITVVATPQALDALANERIFPTIAEGKIVVVIEKPGDRKP